MEPASHKSVQEYAWKCLQRCAICLVMPQGDDIQSWCTIFRDSSPDKWPSCAAHPEQYLPLSEHHLKKLKQLTMCTLGAEQV
jgi:hypothetical protein